MGEGRFKHVYRGFDEKQGIDIAWSKIIAEPNHLSHKKMERIVEELSEGIELDHPHVIKSYQCWEDAEQHCINSITEYFTSGTLREYRQRNRLLELKAVKKWGRQILQGLAYLHQHNPPVVHGDLRPDKIYINGYSGNIKIGDRGLEVLVPKRFDPGVMPEGDPSNQYTRSVDIFAFGLVMLEMVTLRRMDRTGGDWAPALDRITDEAAKDFISGCLSPPEQRPTALQLLEHPFLQIPSKKVGGELDGPLTKSKSDAADRAGQCRRSETALEGAGTSAAGGNGTAGRASVDDDRPAECEVGSVRGEDYLFQFTGKIKNGKLHFRLHMLYEGDDDEAVGTSKTIDFVYDPEVDTPDEIAAEISSEFNLSSTDRDICAAALKEWLAKEMG